MKPLVFIRNVCITIRYEYLDSQNAMKLSVLGCYFHYDFNKIVAIQKPIKWFPFWKDYELLSCSIKSWKRRNNL